MSLLDDIETAKTRVTDLAAQLVDAQASLAALEASAVKGGPDVSSAQGDVDWAKVKAAGYDLVFPKVADGDVVDATFSSGRIAAIKSAGLSYAPYYYGRVASAGNNERNARAECAMAVYFATRQGWGKAGDLPMVYDFEEVNDQTAAKAAAHLAEWVVGYRGLMGHYPILYTAPAFFGQINLALTDAQRSWVRSCPLWIAHWSVSAPTVPAPWTDWTFWQYTNKATVSGVTGAVDNNRANLTKTALDGLRIR